MKKNNEADATQLGQGNQQASTEEEKNNLKSGIKWKNVVLSKGAGLFVGGVAASLMSMTNPETNPAEAHNGSNSDDSTHPEWSDGEVQVATSMDDSMSFSEAFAAAREEVGPGGAFEWHGQVYGTFYAEEWNQMTAEQRAEYESHFSWSHIDTTAVPEAEHYMAQNDTDVDGVLDDGVDDGIDADVVVDEGSESSEDGDADDDIEVVHVDHADEASEEQSDGAQAGAEVDDADNGVEVLGVEPDTESAGDSDAVDGQDVVLVDVDGGMEFDVMAEESADGEQIVPDESLDISGDGLAVEQIGVLADGASPVGDDSNLDVSVDGNYDV